MFQREKHQSAKIPWLTELKSFCLQASIVGLRYVASPSASVFRRSIWTLLLVVGALFTTYQIQNRVVYYAGYPVSVNMRVEHFDELRFPTVTVCNENIITKTGAERIGQADMFLKMFPPFPIPDFVPNFTSYKFDNVSWYDRYDLMSQSKHDAISVDYEKTTGSIQMKFSTLVDLGPATDEFEVGTYPPPNLYPGSGLQIPYHCEIGKYDILHYIPLAFTDLNEIFKRKILRSMVLAECQFNAKYCDYKNHMERIPTNMGFCTSINHAGANLTSRQPGSTGGMLLMMHVNQSDYLVTASSSAGFRVLLHEPEDKPLMLERGFKVSPGMLTQVAVDVRQVTELPKPYGNCEPSPDYRQSNCLADCKAKYVVSNCSCKKISMPGDAPVCDPKTMYECVTKRIQAYVRDNEATKCDCPRQCRRLVYNYRVSQARLSNFVAKFVINMFSWDFTADEVISDYASLEVFFSELKYAYIETKPAYTVLALMCDIGGALGLILGSTMLTFCEFADFLFTLAVAWVRGRTAVDIVH